MIFDGRVSFFPFQLLTTGERASDERNALIHFDMGTDDRGFADDHASAMIDKEMRTDMGAGMDIDPRSGVGPFGHDSGDEREFVAVEKMRTTLDSNGFEVRIGEDNFVEATRGGIPFEGGGDIFGELGSDKRNGAEKLLQDFVSADFWAIWFAEAETFTDFLIQPIGDAKNTVGGDASEIARVDGIGIVEAGEKELQDVFTNRGDGPFRRKI